jgi:FkbM family methyltransferase
MRGVIDDLVYDVGFHRGEDTAYYLRKGYRVVAFEANPDLLEGGRRRFQSELADGRLELVGGAVSDSADASVAFYKNPETTVWGTTSLDWVARNHAEVVRIDVPVVCFAEHLERTGTPYFVKIDIEGADRVCLEALLAADASPAMLSIESTKTDIDALRGELDILEQIGFSRFAAVQQARIGGRVIVAHTRAGEPFSYRFEEGSSGGFGEDVERWGSRADVECAYETIFRSYRLRGDGSFADRALRKVPLIRRVLAGWYDTHAAR